MTPEPTQALLYAIGLLGLGLVLLILEVFVISFGLLSLLALAALAGSVYFAFQVNALIGWLFVIIAPVLAFLVARYGIRRIKRSSVVPKEEITADAGYRHAALRLGIEVGSHGVLVTPTRPSGRARFDQGECDVYSPGLALESGDTVVVTSIEGPTVTVSRDTADKYN